MKKQLTSGNETKSILAFALPLIIGNLCQQLYNVADSIIVGQLIGPHALAAVGSSFTTMVFLTSIILGLCMGASILFSEFYGARNESGFRNAIFTAFLFTGAISLVLNIATLLFTDPILRLINTPKEIYQETRNYIVVVFYGILFVFLYNFFSSILRSMGNSMVPLFFLVGTAILNVALDIVFIAIFSMGVAGAAWATIVSQALSAFGLGIYCFIKFPHLFPQKQERQIHSPVLKKLAGYSLLTSAQQSMMNFGILMIQSLVNSFGVAVMAAFSAAVKIESFAYSPAQEYGNAFSIFIAQNNGAQKSDRIHKGIRSSLVVIFLFCTLLSALVVIFAPTLMLIFVHPSEMEIVSIGVQYLRTVAPFYFLIGYLFMLYGLYRGLGKAGMSIVLTLISLGLRVALAYIFAPFWGVNAIWWAIPAGWFVADAIGLIFLKHLLFFTQNNTIEQDRQESQL